MEYSTLQNDTISVPQMPYSMTNSNFKPSPKVIPGSPSNQSIATPKLQYQSQGNKIGTPNLQYQRKTSTPTIIYQNKPQVISVNRSPKASSPPDHSSKSPKIHNIKNGARSPILTSSQSKSPVLNSRFNIVYNSQDYVQPPRIRRGISEKNIKQYGNDDLIYDTQKPNKNYISNTNSPLFIKDGNLISSSYQVSSSNNYLNNDSYPFRSESVKSASTFKIKNAYEGTSSTTDNNNSYYNNEPYTYTYSDSDDEYINSELNESMLDKYTDSLSDSELLSPSSSLFNPSPPKSMTQLYHKNSSLFKPKKPIERSNSSSSNRRKNSTGSLRNEYESDKEQYSKTDSASQHSKNHYRPRSNSRSDVNGKSSNYYRSRSNSKPDINADLPSSYRSRSNSKPDINADLSNSYRPRSNSKPESVANYSNSYRSRSNSNTKLESYNNIKNNSNYHSKSTSSKDRTTNNDNSARSHSHSRSRSHSRSEHEHHSKSKSRSHSRSISRSRSRSNSQSIVNSKINSNKLPTTSNVNTINTIFSFTNMKNSLNSPDNSPNIHPSSYSSEFSLGSFSDKELYYNQSPGLNHSSSVNSVNNPSLKFSNDNQSISSSYIKGKSKYSNYSGGNSYSHHPYSSSSQSHLSSQIPIATKPSKSNLDTSQQSYNSLKNINPCFPESIIRNRSHSNSQVNNYSSIINRNRSLSNNTIGTSKITSPYNKPSMTMSTNNQSETSSIKSKLNDVPEYSYPRSTSS
ncbi:hypothetical protein LY90DRAFT_131628 [Neocallimastix californiae]|uniref:Uncharacterized protein n=1 Tax=Neocallimastix californiae TaxID=1754190 RepID=A0A1Y2EW96_9FUNG|nr:hypothetical protein LY90DRAFT_131628 [Neocallimastix californiae]|eukprot:ORY75534.1 hypothetical protein LY90DRAFT_131628 [Neocallimastix californiae]